MQGKNPRYSEEFKREIVRLVRTGGQTPAQVGKELGVSERQVRRWVRGEFIDPGPRLALTAAERAELKSLRKQVKVLKQEQEILRKAAAFFAEGNR